MAIAPAGAAYKSLTFDNKTSREFGVYITGEAVYNAPEREVEMISIPGRNGSFALDKGRFENIPVKYPAGLFGDSETNFRTALSDFRNFLCSKKGYCRLTDEYNPDEYRLGVYKSGLEVDNVRNIAGEFDILFDCMPQRWLTSGEVKQTIASSGNTITNPTLFDSKPLLEVEGYGTIEFNGHEIVLEDGTVGSTTIHDAYRATSPYQYSATTLDLSVANLNAGDPITIPSIVVAYTGTAGDTIDYITGLTQTASPSGIDITLATYDNKNVYITYEVAGGLQLTYGTAVSEQQIGYAAYDVSYRLKNGTNSSANSGIYIRVAYDGDSVLKFYFFVPVYGGKFTPSTNKNISAITAVASRSILGHPTYIDCDLGECYKYENDQVGSLNAYIDLGSELPTLAPGSNTITFDNTITSLKITPRWYKL